jgi:hypothetical protein
MKSERGTTLVEFSLIFMMMMMLAIGSFEWGMGFHDRLAVSQSVREAARVGSAFGDHPLSDCAMLEAGAGALSSIGGNDVKEIWIYESDDTGTVGSNKQRYRPAVGGDNPLLLACNDGWYKIEENWVPSARDNTGPVRDWIGVRVVLDHTWKTNFLWWNGTVEWQESSVFHFEPKVIS